MGLVAQIFGVCLQSFFLVLEMRGRGIEAFGWGGKRGLFE